MNSNMVLVGFLIMLACQDIVAFKVIKRSPGKGLLCAMVPGYLLYDYYESSQELRQVKPVIGWLVGLGVLLMGFMR